MDRIGARACFDNSGLAPLDFAERVVTAALERIGDSWERGHTALSQVYMGGKICEDLLGQLLPQDRIVPAAHPPMAITVLDEFHPLGKRIVASVLRANGFCLTDYGQTKVGELVDKVELDGVRVLLVSALMLPAALKVREVRSALDRRGLDVKLVVGGAPFRLEPGLWREVGADATSDSASGAIPVLQRIIKAMPWQP